MTQQKHIPLIPVESKQLAAIGYDDTTRTLRIQFQARKDGTPGSVYDYANVEPETYDAFITAPSKGKFFGAHIKPHADKHPFTKHTHAA